MDSASALAWAVKAFRDGRNDEYARYQAYLDGDQDLQFAAETIRRSEAEHALRAGSRHLRPTRPAAT